MKFKKLLSAVSALAIVASAFAAMAVTASAADTTYTWDFIDLVENGDVASGTTITEGILKTNSKLTEDTTNITDGKSVKSNGKIYTALEITVPDGKTATISYNVAGGGTGYTFYIGTDCTSSKAGTVIASDSILKKAWAESNYSHVVDCNKTYYLYCETAEPKIATFFIKNLTLTVTPKEDAAQPQTKAFTFDGVTLSTEPKVTVTVDGVSKTGTLPTRFSGMVTANVAIVIKDIPADAENVSAVLN